MLRRELRAGFGFNYTNYFYKRIRALCGINIYSFKQNLLKVYIDRII